MRSHLLMPLWVHVAGRSGAFSMVFWLSMFEVESQLKIIFDFDNCSCFKWTTRDNRRQHVNLLPMIILLQFNCVSRDFWSEEDMIDWTGWKFTFIVCWSTNFDERLNFSPKWDSFPFYYIGPTPPPPTMPGANTILHTVPILILTRPYQNPVPKP